jgi:hypothetical protein
LGRAIDFEPIKALWLKISDQRLDDYRAAIPEEWSGDQGPIDAALSLIRDARDKIDGCLQEISRVLT